MKVLRALVFTLMAFAMLPWGGVAAAVVAREMPQVEAVEAGAKLSAPRRCRGVALIGSSCGQERWVIGLGQRLLPVLGVKVVWAPVVWGAVGRVPGPPEEPPRGM